jgi:uncharacterized protein (UPF0303 family)
VTMTSKEGGDLDRDLERIALQERRLRFERFDAGTAWELGSLLRAAGEARGASLVIDVSLYGQQLFHCALPGATPDNADWVRRKRNTVLRFHRSSSALSSLGFGSDVHRWIVDLRGHDHDQTNADCGR